jgi:glycosyltransferase involved in cell wall biosynthesis
MRIGIDIRKYFDTGIGTYIQNLLFCFQELDQENDYYLFVAPADSDKIELSGRFRKIINASSKYSLSELFSLSRQANKTHVDVFHSPHYTLPVGLNSKRVVTIHDIIHLRFREYFSIPQRIYARTMIAHACERADVIITDSQYSKDDIVGALRIPRDKIKVIYLGIGQGFRALGKPEREMFCRKYSITGKYVLYVGNFKPHKNLDTLLKAFAQLKQTTCEYIVLVGDTFESYPHLQSLAEKLNLQSRLKVLGKLSLDDVVRAYNFAEALVLPSMYEGFGSTTVEAMACGTPVIASNASAIPEIVGDAAVLFSPKEPDELAYKLDRTINDQDLRALLIQKGYQRRKLFSYEECAALTLETYRGLCQS